MSDNIRYQVFISSTYEDLKSHRQKLILNLLNVNAIPVGMEMFPASDDKVWSIIQKTIANSDYYIVVIGGKYGSLHPDGVSYTEKEYDHAIENGIPAIGFIHAEPHKISAEFTETDPELRKKLEAFKTKVKEKACRFWHNEDELVALVISSLWNNINNIPRIGWVRGDKAKTIEELERISFLQERLNTVEKELYSYKNQDADIIRVSEELNERISINIFEKNSIESELSVTVHRMLIFTNVCSTCLVNGEINRDQIKSIILNKILHDENNQSLLSNEHKYSIKDEYVLYIIHFLTLNNLFTAKMIAKTTPSNPEYRVMHRIISQPNIVYTLTDYGKRVALYIKRNYFKNQITVISSDE